MKGYCSKCGCTHLIQSSFTGKFIAGGLSAVFAKEMKNPWLALGVVAVSTVAGHYVDKEIEKACPTCGTALQILSVA